MTFCCAQGPKPGQIKPPVAPELLAAPALSLGSNADYQKAVLVVEQAMEKGDFAAANAAMRYLPHRGPRIAWDDSNVPERLRSVFQTARDEAVRDWSRGMSFGPTFVAAGAPADMKISFEPYLNKPVNATKPLTVAAFFATDPQSPRLDFVIGLKHGDPLADSTEVDVANDIRFGLGLYMGVAETPLPGGVMYRAEKPSGVIPVGPYEQVIAEHIFVLDENLQACIDRKQKVAAGLATAFVNPLTLQPHGVVLQGKIVHFTIQVTNRGTAPMETRLVPGCSCFSSPEPKTIPAGESVLYPLDMNTVEYPATVNKTIVLVTSDPNHPAFTLPLHVPIQARYRFLEPQGDTILVGKDGGEFTVYLAIQGAPFTIESQPTLVGVRGTVTYEPWSGVLPDPALGEPARLRKGYKLNIDVKPPLAPGQTFVSVDVITSDSTFRTISARLLAQHGIVAIPDSAYLGHVAPVQRTFEVTVTRPGKPFHIIGLTSNDPRHIHVSQYITKGKPWEHIVRIVFDGQVQAGDYAADILVRTDDKEQPKISIPISATVE
ncbi:MAG: hypothetical protein ACYC96_14115 [Fimbriimonadaceae bacterium]